MGLVLLLLSTITGDLPGGFPTRYSAKTVLSVGAGRRTGNAETKTTVLISCPREGSLSICAMSHVKARVELYSVFILFGKQLGFVDGFLLVCIC